VSDSRRDEGFRRAQAPSGADGILCMEGEEDSSGSVVQRPPPPQQQIRVVRCPKCDKLLPELPNYSVYVCGGCGATLQGRCTVHPPTFFVCNHSLPYFSPVLIGHPCLRGSLLSLLNPPAFFVALDQQSNFTLIGHNKRFFSTITWLLFEIASWGLLLLGWAVSWDADMTSSFRPLLSSERFHFSPHVSYSFYAIQCSVSFLLVPIIVKCSFPSLRTPLLYSQLPPDLPSILPHLVRWHSKSTSVFGEPNSVFAVIWSQTLFLHSLQSKSFSNSYAAPLLLFLLKLQKLSSGTFPLMQVFAGYICMR
jgi:hypothetical protein